MPRRFQFDLRALAIMAALAALPFGAWHWLRRDGSALTVGRAVVGEPVTLNVRFFHPKSIENSKQVAGFIVWAAYDNPSFNPWPKQPVITKVVDVRRSWGVFLRGDATAVFSRPGRYHVRVKYPLIKAQIDEEVLVEEAG